ncbi:MAG TPA: type II and III secretion system protein family protein [Methylophilaceae bacterium]|nr:type II and III secretion system protein family protein [Methylophilaceae bacterium]
MTFVKQGLVGAQFSRIHRSRWALGIALLLAVMSVAAETSETLAMEVGRQEVYTHPQPIKRVAVSDPAVVSINVLTARNLLLTGKTTGVTEVSVWENEQDVRPARVIKVMVNTATDAERRKLEVSGAAPLKVEAVGADVVLTGAAGSLEKHALAQQALDPEAKGPLDASMAAFDSQVQIDIKIVEVSRQNLMRAGFFIGKNEGNTTLAIGAPGTLSAISNDGSGFALESNSGFLPLFNAFNLIFGNSGSGLFGALSVLEANGFAYTLAEPSLTTVSGQSATFLAGGEFPIPIRSGSGGDSSVTVTYKEYGVRLMLSPTVLDGNRIFLKVSPEVSELDFANAVQSGGVAVPGLRVRRTDTSVSLGNGESFVISGLVSRNTLSNVDKFPWLGDLPVIGAFFRSTRFDREDKELLMVVTPHLVRPIARNATLPELPGSDVRDYKPSYSEMFFQTGSAVGAPATGMSR